MKKIKKIFIVVLAMVMLLLSFSTTACGCDNNYVVTKELFIEEYARLTKVKSSTPYNRFDFTYIDDKTEKSYTTIEIAFDEDYGCVYVVNDPFCSRIAYTKAGLESIINAYEDKYTTSTYAYNRGTMWIISNYSYTDQDTKVTSTGHYEWYFNSEGFLTIYIERTTENGTTTSDYKYVITNYYNVLL